MTKTIFISSFHGLVSRVLASGLIDKLTNSGHRVVLLVPTAKKEFFSKTFHSPRVIIEPIDFKLSRWDRLFLKLSWLLLPTKTMNVKWHCDIKSNLGYYLNVFITKLAFVRPWANWLFRFSDNFYQPQFLDKHFNDYQPQLVFATDMQSPFDVCLLKAANSHKIRTVGMIRSWDNATAKGLLRFITTKIFVNNQIVKEELVSFHGVNIDDIIVVGIPHYDLYTNRPRSSRTDFLKSVGIIRDTKIILLTPEGDRYVDTDWQIFEMLKQAVDNNLLPSNVQILVRLPPSDTVALHNFKTPPYMFFHQPGTSFGIGLKTAEMSLADIYSLADQIYHADLVVTGLSTIMIDAVSFNKPVVTYAMDGWETDRSYCRSMRRYCDYEYIKKVISTGGVRLVTDQESLLKGISEYLTNPKLDDDSREILRQEQCWKLDGQSSERLAMALIKEINYGTTP